MCVCVNVPGFTFLIFLSLSIFSMCPHLKEGFVTWSTKTLLPLFQSKLMNRGLNYFEEPLFCCILPKENWCISFDLKFWFMDWIETQCVCNIYCVCKDLDKYLHNFPSKTFNLEIFTLMMSQTLTVQLPPSQRKAKTRLPPLVLPRTKYYFGKDLVRILHDVAASNSSGANVSF